MHKKMKISLMILMITSGSLMGCNVTKLEDNALQNQESTTIQKKEQIKYSNLVDDKTQKEVEQILLKLGVSEQSVDTFIEWVKDFNSKVGRPMAFKEGFTGSDAAQVDYGDVILDTGNSDSDNLQMDTNCRLAAYLLFRDFVNTDTKIDEPDNYLMFDIEAINTDDKYKFIKEEPDKFNAIFNPVLVDKGTDVSKHEKQIQEEWQKRGISFKENTDISLITVFMHDPYENKRFVGHTGVLIKENDDLLFIEKYGPYLPYQCTKFSSEQEVVDYLLSRKDFYGDGTEARPIIMKNNVVISNN